MPQEVYSLQFRSQTRCGHSLVPYSDLRPIPGPDTKPLNPTGGNIAGRTAQQDAEDWQAGRACERRAAVRAAQLVMAAGRPSQKLTTAFARV